MFKIIKELEADNSRLVKEAILKREADAGNTTLFDGIRIALNPFVTFGVRKVPIHGGPDGQGLPIDAFNELTNLLYNRLLTGNDARDAIELAMSAATQDEWNYWYRRILTKDLRCGVSEKTVNKVLKGTSIPPVPIFECALANDGAKQEKKIKGIKILEPKLDGVRCLTIIDQETRTVTQYTRNGKLLENFSHITNALAHFIDDFGRSYVIDSEVVSKSFQDLMKQVHRKDDVQATDAKLAAFDIIPLSEFRAGKGTMGQKRRSKLLKSFEHVFAKASTFSGITGNCIVEVVPQKEVDLDSLVGQLEFKQFNIDAIDAGYEGIMVKDPGAIYECKRTDSWLKIKPVITVDLTIVAVEEGTGKNLGKLGALVCEGTDQGKFIKVNVGSGLTDDQRDEIWTNQSSILGQVVEIKADCITQNQDAENTYSLRFPRFERFRGFIAGDKI
jgi:DNA ligase-1